VSRTPIPLERLNQALPSPCTTQLKGTIPERWIQAKSPTKEGRVAPASSCQARYGQGPGACTRPGHGTRSDEAIRLRGELLER
jgi:hypothetical protein